jgi:pyridoxamine 5'-phosphate oxidase
LVFYTNYESEKGKQIEGNSNVSMLFFWHEMQRQVRIQGKAYKMSNEESDANFKTRPRSSQVGAWASNQSQRLNSSTELKERVKAIEIKFPGDIPRPDFWGGYAVKPELFEFWQGKPSRLHDRLIFKLENGKWNRFRKNP